MLPLRDTVQVVIDRSIRCVAKSTICWLGTIVGWASTPGLRGRDRCRSNAWEYGVLDVECWVSCWF